MKRTGIRLWCALLLLPWGAAAQTPQEGFIGFRWGTPLQEVRQKLDLTPVREEGQYAIFDLGDIAYDGIDLRGCGLEFVSGRLAGGFCRTEGREDSRRLRSGLERRLGKPMSVRPYTALWSGPDTYADYDEDDAGNAYLYTYSRRLNTFVPPEK